MCAPQIPFIHFTAASTRVTHTRCLGLDLHSHVWTGWLQTVQKSCEACQLLAQWDAP